MSASRPSRQEKRIELYVHAFVAERQGAKPRALRGVSEYEDRERIRLRDAFTAAFKNLSRTAAKVAGCAPGDDFEEFHAKGVAALYGGDEPRDIKARRRLDDNDNWLDYAGIAELKLNIRRLKETDRALKACKGGRAAALEAQEQACAGLRAEFIRYNGTRPEGFGKAEHISYVHAREAARAVERAAHAVTRAGIKALARSGAK